MLKFVFQHFLSKVDSSKNEAMCYEDQVQRSKQTVSDVSEDFTLVLGQKNASHKETKCDICNKVFAQPRYLLAHKLTHIETKNYQCAMCNKSFAQSSYLATHKLTHSGIKKYQCPICNKAFTHSSNLSTHKLSHSTIKKYQCDMCNNCLLYTSRCV